MSTFVFCLEEPSAKELLYGMLPKLLENKCLTESVELRFLVFKGKQDLEKQLVHKIKYWLKPESFFIVLRDQNSGNCIEIKKRLVEKCAAAGHPDSLICIVCRELENWYLGDLNAVEKGLGLKGLSDRQDSKKFRNPDNLNNAKEELQKLTQNKYQTISSSRAIAPFIDITNNNSVSFKFFMQKINCLLEKEMQNEDTR